MGRSGNPPHTHTHTTALMLTATVGLIAKVNPLGRRQYEQQQFKTFGWGGEGGLVVGGRFRGGGGGGGGGGRKQAEREGGGATTIAMCHN